MTCPSIRSPSAEHDVDVAKASNALAQCALQAIGRRFPHKLDHLILNAQDVLLPTDLHPIFDGSYDWHSSVHMHWSLLVLRQIGVDTTTELAIKERFDSTFTPALVQRELDYVRTPGRGSFERPYGLAWLLKLQTELDGQSQLGRVDAARWGQALRPLTEEVAAQLSAYLANLHYAVRVGTHANTAFSMLLANDYAIAAGDERLGQVVKMRALAWFAGDRAYPARYEPSGSDFLSPGLCEALLMKRTLRHGGTANQYLQQAGQCGAQGRCVSMVRCAHAPRVRIELCQRRLPCIGNVQGFRFSFDQDGPR
jgi:hypothetical protein